MFKGHFLSCRAKPWQMSATRQKPALKPWVRHAGTDVALISTGESGPIPTEDDLWEILPPLQPGLPARRVRKGSVPSAPSFNRKTD